MKTTLKDRALMSTVLCEEYVEAIWNDRNTGNCDDLQIFVRQLVLSHERLRIELKGAESLIGCPHLASLIARGARGAK